MNLSEFIKYKAEKPLYALIGMPLKHSVSPELHEYIWQSASKPGEYITVELLEDELAEFVKLARKKLCGFNITIPYKEKIIPFLDTLSERAAVMKSVNTVTVQNQKLLGFNTDVDGIKATFVRNHVKLKGKKALLIGYGGAARAAVEALSGTGAALTVTGRSIEKARLFVSGISFDGDVGCETIEAAQDGEYDIVINATPAGMDGQSACPIERLPGKVAFVFDMIFSPLETPFLAMARRGGVRHENGLLMLTVQGIRAEELWLKEEFSKELAVSAHAFLAAKVCINRLKRRFGKESILLSGFMGCGKTTVGKVLAKRLGFEFYDVDRMIEKDAGMPIGEIFEKLGEAHFRALEHSYLHKLSSLSGAVISAGGGAMISQKNYETASKGAAVIYLKAGADFLYENVKRGKDRPLLLTDNPRATLEAMLLLRAPLYEKHCDLAIDAEGEIKKVVHDIIYAI